MFWQIDIYRARNRSILARKISRATFRATFSANGETPDHTLLSRCSELVAVLLNLTNLYTSVRVIIVDSRVFYLYHVLVQ